MLPALSGEVARERPAANGEREQRCVSGEEAEGRAGGDVGLHAEQGVDEAEG